MAGEGLRLSAARTGRVNVYAEEIGVLRVDRKRLREINAGPGVALATLRSHSAVRPGRMVATLKVIPQLEKRTGYLATIGNVATLLGLMGTIYGLILSFAAVGQPGIDAAAKSTLLASGIAAAMNTTFMGLIPDRRSRIASKESRTGDPIGHHCAPSVSTSRRMTPNPEITRRPSHAAIVALRCLEMRWLRLCVAA